MSRPFLATTAEFMNSKRLGSKQRRPRRKGVAAAEFAVCLPVIVLLVLAMIESCTMIFLKQSLTIAAYEGVHTALENNANDADVLRVSQQILTERRVKGGTTEVRPGSVSSVPVGEYITVTVSAPAEQNTMFPGSFFNGRTLTGSATMMKEL